MVQAPLTLQLSDIRQAAVAYLARYAASAAQLRAVLGRKILRHARQQGQNRPAPQAKQWVDDVVAELEAKGLLSDVHYAETKTASLQRKGASRAKIAATLHAKGVSRQVIQQQLQTLSEEDEAAALQRYLRRKRMGPHSARGQWQPKDYAKLQRAGFGGPALRALNIKPIPDDAGDECEDGATDGT
ncbi:MAG: regulatory protein RecX [Alphaproteobacteria bacterium]|nr:regulatory protein RecX [Alphaproteobacteria bacterium]